MKKEYIAPSILVCDVDVDTNLLDGSMSLGEGLPGDTGEANGRDFYEPFDFSDAIQE